MAKDKNIIQRLAAPTPKFFKRVRTIGVVIGAVGAALLTAPVSLPLAVTTIAGYLVTIGAVSAAVSQTTVVSLEDPA